MARLDLAVAIAIATFFILFCLCSVSLSKQEQSHHPQNKSSSSFSLSFPLKSHALPHHKLKPLRPSPAAASAVSVKAPFKSSMVPVVSLPIRTPPQTQDMILDTGSQLSWIQCQDKAKKKSPSAAAKANTTAAGQPSSSTTTTTFDPSLSSFSVLSSNHSLWTSCDQNQLCHYSYFYADCTGDSEVEPHQGGAEGNKKSSPPSYNSTVVYEGTGETSGASARDAVAGLVSVGVAVWRLWQLS